jgi:hypothetical protein
MTAEYRQGEDYARQNRARFAELYTSQRISTPELWKRLADDAERIFPAAGPADLVNAELSQMAWIAGVVHLLLETMRGGREATEAMFEIALEVGTFYGVLHSKAGAFRRLATKGEAWWSEYLGDASPAEIVNAYAKKYRRDKGRDGTHFEVLADFGSRELNALDKVTSIERIEDGPYKVLEVSGGAGAFSIMENDVWQGKQRVQAAGDLVG